jgi:hypothetical protein
MPAEKKKHKSVYEDTLRNEVLLKLICDDSQREIKGYDLRCTPAGSQMQWNLQ